MKKTNELVKAPNTTMYFPRVELTFDELDQLYVIGHVVPSWLRMVMVNSELLDTYLDSPPKRLSKTKALEHFTNVHQNDNQLLSDLYSFSSGQLELIDLSVKYGLFYKDIKTIFIKCLPDVDVNLYWKKHKKHSQSKTSMQIYGVSHTSKAPEIDAKRKNTMLERYGVDNNMKSPELRQQFTDNMMKTHGVKYAYQLANQVKIDNWHRTLFDTLVADELWSDVLHHICEQNNWSYSADMFDNEHLNIRHRDFIITEDSHTSVDNLLTAYKEFTHEALIYPTNILFRLNIVGRFNRTWLRYYSKLELISVNDDSIQPHKGSSNYETIVMNILDQNNIHYLANHRKTLDGKELDFYLPEHNIGIEINPNCTHNSNEYALATNRVMYESYKEPKYHYQKYLLAKEKGITLIQLFANDLSNEQLMNVTIPRLLSMLNGYNTRLYARKVDVRKAQKSELKSVRDFINKHHSQKNTPATEYWGYWYNEELQAAASFTIKNDTAELKRLCFPSGTQIIGGLSKLIKSFLNEHNDINTVTSFSDNNLGNGNGYKQAGATFIGETGPSLKYISWSDPSDTYSWMISTPWGAKRGVIAKDSGGKIFNTQSEINQYIECDLSHRTDNKFGYDKIYTSGSKKWIFER